MVPNDRKVTVLVPQYLRRFTCDGLACEDSCCEGGWIITVDRHTYKRMNNLRDSELKPLTEKFLRRNRKDPTEEFYASLQQDPELGRCAFLTGEKLCRIQQKHGAEYLCKTCLTYPRYTNRVSGVYEESASLSCPIACHGALLNPEPMEFDEIQEDADKRRILACSINPEAEEFVHKPIHYFWPLRVFTIDLLQDRSYRLEERLLILGLFYHALDGLMVQRRLEGVPSLIDSYNAMVKQGDFKEYLEKIPTQTAIQMELIKRLADERVLMGNVDQRYLDCFTECLHGIHYTLNQDKAVADIAENYAQAYREYYQPFIESHQHLLENYLVNYVFKNLFPFSGKESFFDNYVVMILHYAMIKLNLVGMAGFHGKNFNSEHLLKLVQSFAKVVEHDIHFMDYIYDLIKKNQKNTLAYMTILIKN